MGDIRKHLAGAAAALLTVMILAVPATAMSDQVYTISDLDVVNQAAPDFPSAALRAGIDGWVVLEFTVTSNGAVDDIEVADSSSRVFHRNAIRALEQWRFQPVQENGQAVPVRASLRFTFAGQ